MNNHNNIRHAYSFLRALLVLVLILVLGGCMTMSVDHSTSLPEAPAAQAQEPLPVPVAFIVHFSGEGQMPINSGHIEMEMEAWRTALSLYAEPAHIYIAGSSPPASMPEFQQFRSTHPAVEISLVHTSQRESGWLQFSEAMRDMMIFNVDFMSMGLIPLPMSDEVSARFSISFPGDGQGNDPQSGAAGQPASPGAAQHYQFTRRQRLAPLFFIPGGDEYSIFLIPPCQSCQPIELTHKELTDWRAEEKRRLLAQYLSEIRPRLAEYARSAQAHTAAAAAPVP